MIYMKVAEFRKDLSKHFDAALNGQAVIIERGGVQYQLVASTVSFAKKMGDKLFVMNGQDPIKTYDATTEKQAPVKTTTTDTYTEKIYQFCKHDAVLGMCKKGCK